MSSSSAVVTSRITLVCTGCKSSAAEMIDGLKKRSTGCKSSAAETIDALKKCSRCRAVFYCDEQCQRTNWTEHKPYCKEIHAMETKVEAATDALISFGKRKGIDYFEEEIGRLYGYLEARPYLYARVDLCHALEKCGKEQDSLRAIELSLDHMLDVMRLNHGDNIGLRDIAPFLLLALNRKQDCFDFLKWWAVVDQRGKYVWGDAPQVKKGVWMYIPRFNDMMEDLLLFEDPKRCGMSLAHMTALWMLKNMLIEEDLKGKKSKMRRQEKQVDKLFKAINRDNRFFMAGIVAPDKLLDHDYPDHFVRGRSSEAHCVLYTSIYTFKKRCPELLPSLIKEYGGRDPVDCDCAADYAPQHRSRGITHMTYTPYGKALRSKDKMMADAMKNFQLPEDMKPKMPEV